MKIKNLIIDGKGVIYKKVNGKRELKKNVKQTLKKLSEKYNLYMLTDSHQTLKEKKKFLKKQEVLQYFTKVRCTREHGDTKKENPNTYDTALIQWNINEEETIYIGHNNKELKNASLAGLKTIKTTKLQQVLKTK